MSDVGHVIFYASSAPEICSDAEEAEAMDYFMVYNR
jgi:hypothetical protein